MGATSAARIRREYELNRKAMAVIAPDKIAKRKKSKFGETLFARFSTSSERCTSVNEGKNLRRLRWWAGVGGSGSKNGSLVKFIFVTRRLAGWGEVKAAKLNFHPDRLIWLQGGLVLQFLQVKTHRFPTQIL